MTGTRTAAVVSNRRLFRDALKQTLRKGVLSVVAVVADVPELLGRLAGQESPTIVIIHWAAGEERARALGAVQELRRHFPAAKLVLLGDEHPAVAPSDLLQAGLSAFLLTDISSDLLQRSLELVLLGHQVFPEGTGIGVPAKPSGNGISPVPSISLPAAPRVNGIAVLSRRENQIMQCLVDGLPNKLIARQLNIAEATVKVHLKALLRKIHARNRTQAAIWALNQANGDSLSGGQMN